MRVFHVIHSVDPRSGGPSHAIRALVRQQVAAGDCVSLLATVTQSSEPWESEAKFVARMKADLSFQGVDFHILSSIGRRRPFSRYAYVPGLKKWVRSRFSVDSVTRPDVVHIHGVFSHVTSCVSQACREMFVPYILRPAGSLDEDCLARGASVLKRMFLGAVLRRDLKGAACVQAMSVAEAGHLRSVVSKSKVVVVPHGVDVPQEVGPHACRGNRLAADSYILFMARLHPIKRLDLLLQAYARLVHRGTAVRLVVAGSDSGAASSAREFVCQAGLQSCVDFVGFQSGERKSELLNSASAFALPSDHENFGVAVVEAMAHGVPVLVTPGVASREYVDESGCGVTVDSTPEAIADGLQHLLAGDRNTLGKRGREFVENNLAWAAVVRQLNDLYQTAINGVTGTCQTLRRAS